MTFPYDNINGYYLSTGNIHQSKIVTGKTLEDEPLLSRIKKFSIIVSKDESVSFYLGSYDPEEVNIPLITYKDISWNSNYTSELLDFYIPFYKITLNYTGNNFKVFIFKSTNTTDHEYMVETGVKMPTNYLGSSYVSIDTPFNGYSGSNSIELDSAFSSYADFSIKISDGELYLKNKSGVTKSYEISTVNLFNFEKNTYLASAPFELTTDHYFQIVKSGFDLFARFYNTGETSEYFIKIVPGSDSSSISWVWILFTIIAAIVVIAIIAAIILAVVYNRH